MKIDALRSFLSLPAPEKRLAAAACWQLQRTWLELQLSSFDMIHRRLAQPAAAGTACTTVSPQRVAELVRAVSWRFRWSDTCLIRSIVITRLLRRRGCPASLRIGAKKGEGMGIVAHAWIEDDEGNVLSEEKEDLSRYRSFTTDHLPKE